MTNASELPSTYGNCYHCGLPGHRTLDCPNYKELRDKELRVRHRELLCASAVVAVLLFFGALLIGPAFVDAPAQQPLTCPPNYATEYTSSGHKYCRLVLPECKQGERR